MISAVLLPVLLPVDASDAPPPPRATTETDSEIRFAIQKLELRFSRNNGRWLVLYDLAHQRQIVVQSQHLASMVLTNDGQRPATTFNVPSAAAPIGLDRGANFPDTTSVGAQLKLTGWHEQNSGDLIWLIGETTQGNWQIQQFYGMKPSRDTITRCVRRTSNGKEETLLHFADPRTPCPEPLENSTPEAPGYPAVLHQQIDRFPAGQWLELDRGHVPGNRAGLLMFRHGNSDLLVWQVDKVIPSHISVICGDWGVWVTQSLWFLVYDSVQAGNGRSS